MAPQSENAYSIPARFRYMENLHIVFWLFKDLSWCMGWKVLGIAMIVPTLFIALLIAWRTRQYVAELCHNLAISVWIVANSYWMISEFFGFDAMIFYANFTYKYLAVIPFVIGILILAYYYLIYRPRHKERNFVDVS